MGSFGERLRREREMRGVSLEDIAGATKIGTRLLRALEEEQFDLLPGGIFNKGFVRAYAKYLGLNEDEAVADYLLAAGESNLDPRMIADQNDSRIDRSGGNAGDSRPAGFPFIPVLILLIVIAAGLGGWRIYEDRMRQRQAKADAPGVPVTSEPRPVDTTVATSEPGGVAAVPGQPASASSGTVPTDGPQVGTGPGNTAVGANSNGTANPGTSGMAGNSTSGAGEQRPSEEPKPAAAGVATSPSTGTRTGLSADQPFEVTVRAKDNAWVSIKSDGKIAVRGIIAPPDVKTVRATDQVVFWTGNAGAVDISFNGQHVALEGGPNTAGSLVFNSHGVVIPKPAAAVRAP